MWRIREALISYIQDELEAYLEAFRGSGFDSVYLAKILAEDGQFRGCVARIPRDIRVLVFLGLTSSDGKALWGEILGYDRGVLSLHILEERVRKFLAGQPFSQGHRKSGNPITEKGLSSTMTRV